MNAGAPKNVPRCNKRRGTMKWFAIIISASAVVVLMLVALPALALDPIRSVFDFGRGETPSATVVSRFDQLEAGAPPGMDPKVKSLSARQVILSAGSAVWVAPTEKGGFCYAWVGGIAGCRSTRGPEQGAGSLDPSIMRVDGQVVRISGDVLAPNVATIVLVFADGSKLNVPFTWVTQPIAAGFFDFVIPPAIGEGGSPPIRLAAYADGGKEVSSYPIAG
jgi:hypothetical protein